MLNFSGSGATAVQVFPPSLVSTIPFAPAAAIWFSSLNHGPNVASVGVPCMLQVAPLSLLTSKPLPLNQYATLLYTLIVRPLGVRSDTFVQVAPASVLRRMPSPLVMTRVLSSK